MIQRDRTAIHRTDLSRPMRVALRDGIVTEKSAVFDYGCGFGDDVRRLQEKGISASGWDPAHRPDGPKLNADVVNLGYVVNVVERPNERGTLLREAWAYASGVLVIAARLKAEAIAGMSQFEDGVITRLQTFQKYYDQDELREWISSTLGETPVAAAPGVFYVFRDEMARESFMASRYRRRVSAPKIRLRDKLFEEHQALLQELMHFVMEHGRLPELDEIEAGSDIVTLFGNIKRAFHLVRRVTGSGQWDSIRAERHNDLLVYLALGRFPRRPKLSNLPLGLQRDIRALFGTYKSACTEGDNLLFAAGDIVKVDEACKAAPFGKLMPTALYVHASSLSRLPGLLRVYEGCARVLTGEVEGTTLIKLRRDEPKISYLAYPKFATEAHPALVRSLRVDLRTFHLKDRDFAMSANPPILHRKEEFVPEDFPNREVFAALTKAEEEARLYENPERIGNREGWLAVCRSRRVQITGHALIADDHPSS